MVFLRAVLLAIEALVSLLLIAVILIQRSKSEGMGLAFGANVGETLFGSRAGNVLTRTTVVLCVVFLLNTLALAKLYSGAGEASLMRRAVGRAAPAAPVAPRGTAAPAAPTLPPSGLPSEPPFAGVEKAGTEAAPSAPAEAAPVAPESAAAPAAE